MDHLASKDDPEERNGTNTTAGQTQEAARQ
jgi:hypothetical protein